MSNNPSDDNNEKKITKTIEEIAPDDKSTSEDLLMVEGSGDSKSCERCGFNMVVKLLGCHMVCRNCGCERTCSDI